MEGNDFWVMIKYNMFVMFFFFSSRRRHTRLQGDWSSDVCSSDLRRGGRERFGRHRQSRRRRGGRRLLSRRNGRLMTADRGREFPPTPTRHSGLSGWEMSGWSRGFAKEGVDLGENSRLTSNTFYSVLLRRSKRSYIVVQYEEGNPDIRVDRVKA